MIDARNSLQGWDVLVVDDEPDSLEVAAEILAIAQANVFSATNGQQALDLIRIHRPRLIIADLSMPVMDGWMLIAALKLDRTTADIPVIALTAHTMIRDRARAIEAGFHNYLTKPLTPATFMRDLLALLSDVDGFQAAS